MQFNREAEDASVSIMNFIDYFEGNVKVTSRNKDTYEKEIKLEKLIEIYESDLINIRKIYAITNLFKNSEKLRSAYRKLERYRDDEFIKPYYDMIDNVAGFLERAEKAGLVEISRDLIAQEQYMEDYNYAVYYMEKYLHSKRIFKSDFLKDEQITGKTFDYLAGIVDEYNPMLSTYYREKNNENYRERRYRTRCSFNEMYRGITTGKTRFGHDFTLLEFAMLYPFKNIDTLNELIEDFGATKGSNIDIKTKNLIRKVVPEKADTIIKYMVDNKMYLNGYNPMTERDIRNTRMIIGDREVTEEDKDDIIRFMNYHEMPYYPKVFNLVRDRQLSEGLYPKDVKSLKKTK